MILLRSLISGSLLLTAALVPTAMATTSAATPEKLVYLCTVEAVVLGAGQDAGAPQIGNADDEGPRLLPASLGIIDHNLGARYMFDATPAITEQLTLLDTIAPPRQGLGLNGIFLTHAHIGHYLGLAYLGREAAGAHNIPVYAMPRMAEFLRSNGPWSQLVELGQIELRKLSAGELQPVSDRLKVRPIEVPHRDEYSETVGFVIVTEGKSVLFLPDLDSWDEYKQMSGQSLEGLLATVDYAFIDATFWDDNELAGRDMSEIPHPRISTTMDRLANLPESVRGKVHFIHYNHTNPVRDPASAQSREVVKRGFHVARRGQRFCLDPEQPL